MTAALLPRRPGLLLGVLLLGGCLGAPRPSGVAAEPPLFTFAVFADPHVGRKQGERQLADCVEWVNAHRASEDIELAFVLGDLGDRLDRAAELLSRLQVPWVPVIGDNTVQRGAEAEFRERFGPHMDALGARLEGWRWTREPVVAQGTGRTLHLHSFAFEHRGVRFLGLDWCTRRRGDVVGEQADLHAFPGGTWDFFRDTLSAWSDAPDDSIVLLSHHPMHAFLFGFASFSPAEMASVEAVTGPRRDALYADFAGHYHVSWEEHLPRAGYTVYVTDALQDGAATVRLVRVHRTAAGFAHEHRLVDARR